MVRLLTDRMGECGDPDLQHVGEQRAQQGADQTVIVLLRTRQHQLPQKQSCHLLKKDLVNKCITKPGESMATGKN